MCTPSFVILYKSDSHGHPTNINLKFKFSNNSKFSNIRKELTEKAKESGLNELVISERVKGINTDSYVFIDPYDYIKRSPELQEKYNQIKKLPQRTRTKEFRKILSIASSYAYLNLAYFLNLKYDVIFVNPGDVHKFLEETKIDHNIFLYLDYSTDKKEVYDYGNTHNIIKPLPHVNGILVMVDKKKAFEFYEELKFVDAKLLSKMDEGYRLIRYFKPVEDLKKGGAIFDTVKKKCIKVVLFIIIVFVLIFLLFLLVDYISPFNGRRFNFTRK